ncbi:MAG: hypothetical protein FWE23_08910 [Chitinivibrionia bacterium]|nr:hypothetical protein [Chitinivibrionia bacterium]
MKIKIEFDSDLQKDTKCSMFQNFIKTVKTDEQLIHYLLNDIYEAMKNGTCVKQVPRPIRKKD